jgi:hypothetical protein
VIGETSRHPEWRVIVELFREATWGDLVAHGTIAAATGLRAETMPYYRHVAQARRTLLRDHDIEVESVPKVGYRRVEPERYGERARRDTRLGRRRISRGARVVKAAPVHLLTAEQVQELEHTMRLLAALRAQADRVIKSMRNVLPPVPPRQALPATTETETH